MINTGQKSRKGCKKTIIRQIGFISKPRLVMEMFMVYNYKAFNREGESFFGTIQAQTREEAHYQLYQQNLIVDELVLLDQSLKIRSVKPETVITFTQLLATALSAHISLSRSLEIILEEFPAKNSFRWVIITLVNELNAGKSFSQALSLFEKIFKPFYIYMVKTGERSGKLAGTVEYIHKYIQKQDEVKKKVQGALLYPGLVLAVAILVLGFFMSVLIPRFQETYAQFGSELPLPTLILVRFSAVIQRYFLVILLVIGSIVFFFRQWIKKGKGRLIWETYMLKFPIVGNIIRKNTASVFSRTFSILLKNGVPLKDALEVSRDIVSYDLFKNNIQKTVEDITEGKSFSNTLRDNPYLPPLLVQAASIGEESGKTGVLFGSLSDFYEKELDASVERITSLLTPILILITGVIVGVIIFSLFLPILNLSQIIK